MLALLIYNVCEFLAEVLFAIQMKFSLIVLYFYLPIFEYELLCKRIFSVCKF